MTDAESLFALAFAGSDAHRVLWLPALASLFASTRVKPWMLGLGAFLIDRAWPFLAMIGAYEPSVVLSAALNAMSTLPQDAVWLVLRLAGMVAVTALCWQLRLMLHGRRTVTTAAATAD